MTQPAAEPAPSLAWTLGDRLRKARRVLGLGQQAFAVRLDVSKDTYTAWETDRNRPRDPVALAKRVELLSNGQVPAAWLLGVDTPIQGEPTASPVTQSSANVTGAPSAGNAYSNVIPLRRSA